MKKKQLLLTLTILFSISLLLSSQSNNFKFGSYIQSILSTKENHKILHNKYDNNLQKLHLNSNAEFTALCDSSLLYLYETNSDSSSIIKKTYTYTSFNALQIEKRHLIRDSTTNSSWYEDKIVKNYYDNDQKLVKQTVTWWVVSLQDYELIYENFYFYDSLHRQIKYEEYIYESGDLNRRVIYGYDNYGNKNFIESWEINTQTQKCERDHQWHYHFTEFGEIDTTIYLQWNTGSQTWSKNFRNIAYFDNFQNDTLNVYERWYYSEQVWKSTSKIEKDYENGKILYEKNYTKHADSTVWIPERKDQFFYNNEDLLQKAIIQYWNLQLFIWENTGRWDVLYDNYHFYNEIIQYSWNDTTQWNLSWKYLYDFDSIGNQLMIGNSNWDKGNQEWEKRNKEYFYYTVLFSEIEEKKYKRKVNIYPNPFTTSTTIEYHLNQPSEIIIHIYNHLGELVDLIQQKQSQGKQQVVWNAEGLPAGIYYFRLQAGEKVATGKIVLMK